MGPRARKADGTGQQISPTISRRPSMKVVALIVGLLFLGLGIASFVPSLVVDGLLFGGIPVNTTFSIVYIIVGAIAVMFGLSRRRSMVPAGPRDHDMRPWV